MSEAIDETIKEVAVNHGVVLSKDDPILILQTMNERMLAQNRKAQQDMLAQFKEEMETISSQWKADANLKAERVLNAALTSSKEAMDITFRQGISESVLVMQNMITSSLTEARSLNQKARKTSQYTLVSSAVMLTISCSFMLFFLSNIVR